MREDTFKAFCDRFNHEAREQDNLMLSNDFKSAVESFFKKENQLLQGLRRNFLGIKEFISFATFALETS